MWLPGYVTYLKYEHVLVMIYYEHWLKIIFLLQVSPFQAVDTVNNLHSIFHQNVSFFILTCLKRTPVILCFSLFINICEIIPLFLLTIQTFDLWIWWNTSSAVSLEANITSCVCMHYTPSGATNCIALHTGTWYWSHSSLVLKHLFLAGDLGLIKF